MLYFFDFRDGDTFIEDEIGVECVDLAAAKFEAAAGLAGYARDVIPGSERREMAIEVRTDKGPVLNTRMVFEIKQMEA